MPDLLDRVRDEIHGRLAELRPLVEEHDRLEAAMRALGSTEGAVPTREGNTAQPARGRRRRTGRRAVVHRRQRAPRGANREAVLQAVSARPGASAGEISQASGVRRPTLYNLLSRLVADGELRKQELPSGQTGYNVATTTAGKPPAESAEPGAA